MIPDQIRDARKQANLTQEQAARICYVTKRTWSRWETSGNIPEAAWELFLLRTETPVDMESSD